ncbi:hypothetical protein PGB28_03570 [Primorskyibacter aestuariivivens]|uniref:hypothetical protein n=1 Tax=Primorskyibacter aestuariivivens TaxID=1888912 RepID=UPI002300C0E9|nr:hypothetical protein [Primorskyibacter aestuariivivens]MDA7427525.1 hypothetical protein [Primorskyibacter aestuariivivens]
MTLFANMMTKARSALNGFARKADGGVNIEAILFLPLLIIATAGSLVFYDAFRKNSLGDKATFTIGDMLSRETDYITPTYIDSTKALFNFLTGTEATENTLRVTVVQYDLETDSYSVVWSEARGSHAAPLSDADMSNAHNEFPVMVDSEQVIVVDTFVDYSVPTSAIRDRVFDARVFTRPRFAPQLVWSGI